MTKTELRLNLSLKTKWFEMTKAGIKTEDYREITPYWIKRFFTNQKDIKQFETWYHKDYYTHILLKSQGERIELLDQKPFTHNVITLGYPSKNELNKWLVIEHKGISIGEGKEEWGAIPGKLYFIIKHGRIIF